MWQDNTEHDKNLIMNTGLRIINFIHSVYFNTEHLNNISKHGKHIS